MISLAIRRTSALLLSSAGLALLATGAHAAAEDDLATAIRKGDVIALRAALDAGADPNARPFLWQAFNSVGFEYSRSRNSHEVVLEMMRLLMEAGGRASIQKVSAEGRKLFAIDNPALGAALFPSMATAQQYEGLGVRAFYLVMAGAVPNDKALFMMKAWAQATLKTMGNEDPQYLEQNAFLETIAETSMDLPRCVINLDRIEVPEGGDRFQAFRAKYGSDPVCATLPDPKNQWARYKIIEQKAEQEALRKKQEDDAKAMAEAKAARDRAAEYERREKARQAKASTAAVAWRKQLRQSGETNCGPVIEMNGKLAKIAAPVAGYGNEHWIRVDKLFPPGYECRFFNGQYQPPAP